MFRDGDLGAFILPSMKLLGPLNTICFSHTLLSSEALNINFAIAVILLQKGYNCRINIIIEKLL